MSSLSPGENDAQRSPSAVVKIRDVSLSYGKTRALDAVSLDIPAGIMVGLIGPDGVGKSSLLSLIAGAHKVQDGHIEVLGGDIAGNERAERRVANAMAGVSRGSKLAAQLLAFGRRQALEPKVVNVTRFVRGMDDMLRRAIGEGIEVETVVGGGLWNTFIDPTQIENALLNLAINARDAMDGTGRLTLEAGNAMLDDLYALQHPEVTAGQYVMLAVSDTGCGMSPDVMERAFEPFFTTKPEGKGTGMGLAMVQETVTEHAGTVHIDTGYEQGCRIVVELPFSAS